MRQRAGNDLVVAGTGVSLLGMDMSGREMLEQAYAPLRQNWPPLVPLGLILLWPRGKRRRG